MTYDKKMINFEIILHRFQELIKRIVKYLDKCLKEMTKNTDIFNLLPESQSLWNESN
jgi:hypothetical protein